MAESFDITDNKQQQQFQLVVNGEMAYLEYRWHNGKIALMHTYVPESLEGKGIASALAKYALEYARTEQIKIIVYCPFVAKYLERHPEYNTLK
ncbi:GNAT family N-acetyltransferase [Flavihumibacter profundi]|uniref:GNAT family N-acetyltransferase n=1 Tax=Flavihumibacter profundi TaxID=2716883 RepID=UPI001CC51B51|nr:GNAT family N-acetyltransferase [Flavihumibacter profundi]MBZ5858703.1 N-acetyltransferase [Flavihumibacter profundi]